MSANGFQTQPQGIGTTHPLLTLIVKFILFVPGCPFNLLFVHRLTQSRDCLITFIKDIFTL